jgi:hypothetical protein
MSSASDSETLHEALIDSMMAFLAASVAGLSDDGMPESGGIPSSVPSSKLLIAKPAAVPVVARLQTILRVS